MANTPPRLRTITKLICGVGDVANAIVDSAVQFFLLFLYTEAGLIAPALAANGLLVGKVWDAVDDPLFGWVSDRTTSRLGKRRIYSPGPATPGFESVWRHRKSLWSEVHREPARCGNRRMRTHIRPSCPRP